MLADKDYHNKTQSDGEEMYQIITKIENGLNAVQNPTQLWIKLLFNLLNIQSLTNF